MNTMSYNTISQMRKQGAAITSENLTATIKEQADMLAVLAVRLAEEDAEAYRLRHSEGSDEWFAARKKRTEVADKFGDERRRMSKLLGWRFMQQNPAYKAPAPNYASKLAPEGEGEDMEDEDLDADVPEDENDEEDEDLDEDE